MKLQNAWCELLLLAVCVSTAHGEWRALNEVTSVQSLPNGVELGVGEARVRITALSPRVVRLRFAAKGSFPEDFSFAVLPNAFPEPPRVEVKEAAETVSFDTGAIAVRIVRAPFRVVFLNSQGEIISQDQPGYPVSYNDSEFRVWKAMPRDEHYFGLGDKSGPLDHRELAFSNWNTDQFGWQESTDPLYKTIPFLLAVRNGSAYGLFLDNTYRSSFDFRKELHDTYSFGSEGGELNYYFFYGPGPKQVVSDFTALVGRQPLPPLFALGYQQCRYSYYPEAEVRRIASEFRKRKIPADVIYLDIDYQEKYRPFTIDRQRFPHFEQMIKDLGSEGFKVVAITDLHIAAVPGSKSYDEGMAKGYFVKNPDGSVYVGKVWPGDSVFPDFTREEVRRWWGSLYADFVKMGIRGFWNDMNEPAVFDVPDKTMPLDRVHSVEGRKTDHREIHNVFGMENVRGTYEGLLRLQPDIRPFVLTRAAYAGTERYAATWTGDNTASWNHLRISLPQIMNLGLSGFAFQGADIGGFNGSATPELLTRWMEVGVFNPMYRNHSEKATRNREPWVDGPEHEAIRKRYIETRYRLLPYIYTGMEEASRTGVPLMRPMFMEFPSEADLETTGEEYMFGRGLLVAPKVWPFLDPYEVILPKGDWYDYWTGEKLEGGKKIKVNPPLDTLPVYVRAGTILPQQPVVQNVGEIPKGPLELRVYAGPDCGGDLYMDDGNTLAYQRGQFLRTHFTCELAANQVTVHIEGAQGPFRPWFGRLQVSVFGPTDKLKQVRRDGKAVTGAKIEAGHAVAEIPWDAAPHEMEFQYGP